jgi:cbb3-type cytochrome c oxidase subunit III
MRSRTASVLLLSFLVACSRDRSSGAAPSADTTQTVMPDASSVAAAPDTASAPQASDTTAARPDTARKVARQPVARKPTPKPPRPQPAAQPEQPDTTAGASPTDTAAAAAPTPPAAAPTTEASAPLRDQYHTAPLDTVSQEVYNGWKQFNLNCARCHGEDVQGTTIAPHLIVSLKPNGPINTKEIFVQTVCAGRPEKGMPAWCALGMDMDKINQIYAYVKGRSDAKIHPGRPAVKAGG